MRMVKSTTLIVIALAIQSVNSGAQGTQLKMVSERETDAFLKQLETDHQHAWAELKTKQSKLNPVWIQPENKHEGCKVVLLLTEGEELPSMKYYWDGECKEGYASGLGRAFQDSTMGLVAWLEEYEKPGQLPLNYYVHYYDMKSTWVGFLDSKIANPMGISGSVFTYSESVANKNFAISQVLFDSDSGITYTFGSDYATDTVRKGLNYANGVSLFVDEFTDPTQQIRKEVQYFDSKSNLAIGYGGALSKDGQVGHVSFEDGVPNWVELPEKFTQHVIKLGKELDAQLSEANSAFQRGNLALEVYKRRTCAGNLEVDFMDSLLYGQICLDSGDFTPYAEKIKELEELAKNRREANAQLALRQGEIDAQNRATYAQQQQAQQQQAQQELAQQQQAQQQLAQQQQAQQELAQQQQAQQELAQQAITNQALNDAAQQSQQMLNNTMNMLNNMLSNGAGPALGSWAGGGSFRRNTSVCHVISNIVYCK